jgi:hypothetical protein
MRDRMAAAHAISGVAIGLVALRGGGYQGLWRLEHPMTALTEATLTQGS